MGLFNQAHRKFGRRHPTATGDAITVHNPQRLGHGDIGKQFLKGVDMFVMHGCLIPL